MSNTIRKGDELMLFYDGEAFAWATSHTLQMNASMLDIATKDNGFWGASEAGKLTWEITTENLYCDDDFNTLYQVYTAKTPVTVAFAKVSNYDVNGLTSVGGDVSAWEADDTQYWSGLAVITSLTVNANTGENATFSATFTGSGPLIMAENNGNG